MLGKEGKTLAIVGAIVILALMGAKVPARQTASAAEDLAVSGVFAAWKLENKRLYASLEEESLRFGIFKENYRLIQESNAKNPGFTLALNPTADLTYEEFGKKFNLSRKGDKALENIFTDLPREAHPQQGISAEQFKKAIHENFRPSEERFSKNWQTLIKSNTSRNMGACNVPNLFAIISGLESSLAVTRKEYVQILSPQYVMDCIADVQLQCSKEVFSNYQVFLQSSGTVLDYVDPYTGKAGKCPAFQ